MDSPPGSSLLDLGDLGGVGVGRQVVHDAVALDVPEPPGQRHRDGQHPDPQRQHQPRQPAPPPRPPPRPPPAPPPRPTARPASAAPCRRPAARHLPPPVRPSSSNPLANAAHCLGRLPSWARPRGRSSRRGPTSARLPRGYAAPGHPRGVRPGAPAASPRSNAPAPGGAGRRTAGQCCAAADSVASATSNGTIVATTCGSRPPRGRCGRRCGGAAAGRARASSCARGISRVTWARCSAVRRLTSSSDGAADPPVRALHHLQRHVADLGAVPLRGQPLGLLGVDHEVHRPDLGGPQRAGVADGLEDGQVDPVHQDVHRPAGWSAGWSRRRARRPAPRPPRGSAR